MKNKTNPARSDDFELLVSHRERQKDQRGLGARAKWYAVFLVIGISGCIGCLWAMIYTSHSEEVAHRLGMTKVANSLDTLLEVLALPALLFFGVLSAYASQRLYQLYKLANNPVIRRRR